MEKEVVAAPSVDLEAENARLKAEIDSLKSQLPAPKPAKKPRPASTGGGLVQSIQNKAREATDISDEEAVRRDVGTAAAAVGAAGTLAVLGADLLSVDADLLALGLGASAAVVAEEDEGVAGRSLRAVGSVASPVLKTTASAVGKAADYAEENELGLKAQAIGEIVLESLVRKIRGVPKPKDDDGLSFN